MAINKRLERLESATGTRHTTTNVELAKRIERVLKCPHLVSQSAYYRIVKLMELCKQRQTAQCL